MKPLDAQILKKSDAQAFFAALAGEMRIVAPKEYAGGDCMFAPMESPKEIAWDYGHDLYPPKQFVLPPFEEMFAYRAGEKVEYERMSGAVPTAIVGIRSCDVSAIRFQENFFGGQIVDPYYKDRSEKTVLFSLVCNKPPKKECFCICCNAGPYLDVGFDVQLTDLGDRFLYEIGSEKGEKATGPGGFVLKKAGSADFAERDRLRLQADSLFETTAYIAKAINFISADEVPDEVWEDIGSTCFKCGACTNLCPVCTCFTVDDKPGGEGSFVRCRSWDSCQYSGFTREASGHNPRPTYGSRVRRRLYHKASYQYITRDGTHGCVGCGRCVSACLTKLGLPDVIKRIRRSMHDHLEPKETAEVKP